MLEAILLRICGPALLAALSVGAAHAAEPPSVVSNGIYPDAEVLLQPYPNASWGKFPRAGHDVVRISPGLYSFRYGGQATRNIFMVTPDGVIVTDPISAVAAALLRAEIRKITPLPVKYVVYSHSHWDHIRGGAIFKAEGATFIAQKNCVAELERRRPPDVVMPDITFDTDYVVKLGGQSLELMHFGTDHSPCNSYMRPGGSPYAFVVDTVIPGRMPLGFMADTDPQGSIDSLRRLEALDIKGIIPGHGTPLAHRSAITERRLYLEALMLAAQTALAQPSPPIDIAASIKLPEFSYLRGYDQDIGRNADRIIYFYYIGW